MTTKEPTKRRTTRGVHAQPKGRTQAGGMRPRQKGAVNETEKRALMTGHTVRILIDYEGWRGRYAKVITPDHGDGKVLVEVTDYNLNKHRVCFLSYEVLPVPMNDTLQDTGSQMDSDTEVCGLIRRCVDLQAEAREATSGPLACALRRRAQRLHEEIRCLQRARAARDAHKWAKLISNPCCTALVIWGGEQGIADVSDLVSEAMEGRAAA